MEPDRKWLPMQTSVINAVRKRVHAAGISASKSWARQPVPTPDAAGAIGRRAWFGIQANAGSFKRNETVLVTRMKETN